MFAHRLRPRVAKLKEGPPLELPSDCVVNVIFTPTDIFGGEVGTSPIATQSTGARLLWNANAGAWTFTSEAAFPRIEVQIDCPLGNVTFHGSQMSVTLPSATDDDIANMVNVLYWWAPAILTLMLEFPVTVIEMSVRSGDSLLNLEIPQLLARVDVTNRDRQAARVASAIEFLGVLPSVPSYRLVASINYFHIARRLLSTGESEFEFWPEAMLNACKSVEALLTPSRDHWREELGKLGFSKKEIEGRVVPLQIIRNRLDVAHVALSPVTNEERNVVEVHGRLALDTVQTVLVRACERVANGTYTPLPDKPSAHDKERRRFLQDLETYVRDAGDWRQELL